MRSQNIFNRVVTNEDSYTELWANLLQYKLVKEFFISNVLHKVECLKDFDFNYRDVTTQYSTDNGRPDLVIETNNTLVLIESKIYTYRALTENQPDGYLKILKESDKRLNVLLFIVPKNYQYQEQLNGREVNIIFWEDIVYDLRQAGLAEVNPIFKHFIDFSNEWFPLEKITFTEKEIDMVTNGDVIGVLSKLRNVINGVEKLSNTFTNIKGSFNANYEDNGIYFKDLDGNNVLYFGMWYYYWEKYNSPLAIGVSPKYNSCEVFKAYFKDKFKDVKDPNNSTETWWYMYDIDFSTQENDIVYTIAKLLSKFFEEYFKQWKR